MKQDDKSFISIIFVKPQWSFLHLNSFFLPADRG